MLYMNTIILPSIATKEIFKQTLGGGVFGTTAGLVKATNEDRLGYLNTADGLRVCIADGHWGDGAADMIVKYWLSESTQFPLTSEKAVKATQAIEKQLDTHFGTSDMDADVDKTPEAAFIAAELTGNTLQIVSYGDCRLLVARQGKIYYQLPTKATWLGAFSHRGMRDRQPIKDALSFTSLSLLPGDVVMLFTDGIDECVYEVPTISFDTIAEYGSTNPPSEAFDKIMNKVFAVGAQDNASLAVISIK